MAVAENSLLAGSAGALDENSRGDIGGGRPGRARPSSCIMSALKSFASMQYQYAFVDGRPVVRTAKRLLVKVLFWIH